MKIKNLIVRILNTVFNPIFNNPIHSFFIRRLAIREFWADILTCIILAIVIVVVIGALYIPGKYAVSMIVDKFDIAPADEQIFQTSLDLFKQQDYRGAIKKSKQLIEEFPKSRYTDSALFNIGAAHTNLQNYDGAREAYKKFIDRFPDSKIKSDAQRRIASSFIDETEVMFNEKKYNQAHQNFNRLAIGEELKKYPDLQALAMYNTALCLIRLGKTDEAFERFSEFTTQFPENKLAAKALNVIARWNYTLKRNYERSLSIYRELLERFPESDLVGGATVGVVLSLHKLNRYQEEQVSIKEFSEQFPENEWIKILESYAEGLKQVSYSELDLTSWEKAEAHNLARSEFNLILIMHSKLLNTPESLDLKGEIRYQIAQSYLAEEKYALAGLAFDKILTEEFSMWEHLQEQTMYQAAYCLKQQGIYDEALGRYLEFTNRFPESEHITDVYFDIGDIYVEKEEKDYDLARYNYNSALKRTTDSNRKSEIHFDFATTYYNQGDYKNAILEYNKWLSIAEYPESAFTVAAKHLIANSYYLQVDEQKNWEKIVVEAYQRVLNEHRDVKERVSWNIHGSPEVPNRLALCAYRISDIYYKLGTQHHKANDTKLAIEYWVKALDRSEKIINEYPTDDVVQFALYNALLIHAKRGQIEGKTKETLVEELDQKSSEYMDKLKKAEANEILLAAAHLKFASVKHEELKDYTGAVTEYAKLWNDYPTPHPRLNLIKLQGKYYEGNCYEKSPNSDTSLVETYKEATTLFKAAFQPLIDTPTIDIPNRDYYLAEATKIFQDLVSRYPKAGEAAYWQYIVGEFYADRKQFKEAITEYEKVIKVYPTSEYAKDARRRIEEIRQTLKEEDSADASSNLGSSGESQTQKQLTAQNIAKIASGSTVLLRMNNDGAGSGFFFHPGLIATNYHVIAGATEGTARLVNANREYAIVGYTAIDAGRDLAILKVRAFGVEPLLLGHSNSIQVNDDIYAVGNPLGRPFLEGTVSYGKISGIREDSDGKWIQMTAPISPGNSGGPVLNNKGKVIGISTLVQVDNRLKKYDVYPPDSELEVNDAKAMDRRKEKIGYVKLPRRHEQNLNFAIHVDDLKALLKRTGPPKPLSDLEIVY